MLSFLFSLVSCRKAKIRVVGEERPPISISNIIVKSSDVIEKVFASPADPELKNFLVQYLPSDSADSLINRIMFVKSIGRKRITVNAGLGTTHIRSFGNNYVILNLIRKDNSVKVKICSVNAKSDVTSDIVTIRTKARRRLQDKHRWRPLKAFELDTVFSNIESKASSQVEEAIRMVKQ